MAVKESLMVKTAENVSSVSIQPQVGDAYMVSKILISPGTATHAIINIDKTTVGYFRLSGTQGNDLSFPADSLTSNNVFSTMIALGLFRPYPVATGESFLVKAESGTFDKVIIEYSEHDSADVKSSDPNGSSATEYDVILYGEPTTLTADQYSKYDKSTSPDEFPKFPFSEVVPAKTVITLHGLEFKNVGISANTQADQAITKYIKFQKERIVLFDDDKNGLPYIGTPPATDTTVTAPGQLVTLARSDDNSSVYLFDTPIIFNEGEDLDIYAYVETVTGSSTMAATDVELGLLTTVKGA